MTAPSPGIDQECVEGYLYASSPLAVMLFLRPPARGSIWVPISGKVDPGDADLEATMRRELLEETGLAEPLRLAPLGWEVVFRGPNGGRWRLHAFGVEVERGWTPRLSAEHERWRWATPEEARTTLHYEDNRAAIDRLVERVGA